MQQALPEDLWFFIILLALLILAYLWNDKAGSSGKKRKRTTTDPDPEPEPTTDPDPGPEPGPGGGERPPEIHAHIHSHSRFSEEVGDEFAVKATFDPGDGDVQEKRVEINGREVNIAEQGDGIFVSEPVRVVEGENVGEVSIKTTAGEDMDRTGFEASEGGDGGDGREDPSVRAGYEIIDEQKGHVRIQATSIPGSLPIEKTIINISSRGENVGGNVDESENCVFESKGLPHGNYIITAIAQDVEGNTGQYTEPFTLKMPGAGPSVPGGGLPGGIFNPQIEVSPEINIDIGSGNPEVSIGPEDGDIPDFILEYLSDMIKFKDYAEDRVESGVLKSDVILYGFCNSYYGGNPLGLSHKPINIMRAMKNLTINFDSVISTVEKFEDDSIRDNFKDLNIKSRNDILTQLQQVSIAFPQCNTSISSDRLSSM